MGQVEKFASISQTRVRLNGPAGQPVIQKVTIFPEEKYPFKITDVQINKEGDIKILLEETEQGQKKGYVLTIENLRQEKSRYFDTVILKTDSKMKPEIRISVYGNIFEPVVEQKGS